MLNVHDHQAYRFIFAFLSLFSGMLLGAGLRAEDEPWVLYIMWFSVVAMIVVYLFFRYFLLECARWKREQNDGRPEWRILLEFLHELNRPYGRSLLARPPSARALTDPWR